MESKNNDTKQTLDRFLAFSAKCRSKRLTFVSCLDEDGPIGFDFAQADVIVVDNVLRVFEPVVCVNEAAHVETTQQAERVECYDVDNLS